MKLRVVLEIARNLRFAAKLDQALSKLLESLLVIFVNADRATVALKDPDSGELTPIMVKYRGESIASRVSVGRGTIHNALASEDGIPSNDATGDVRGRFGMMSQMLIGRGGRFLGMIQLDALDQKHSFNGGDADVLAAVASQTAIAVENARLREKTIPYSVQRRELALARSVQQGFFPTVPPRVDGYEFFDFHEPASRLTGDYRDYCYLPDGCLAVMLGSVSGTGIPAALLVARVATDARHCLLNEPTPATFAAQLNRIFWESHWEERFITMVLAVLDPFRHEVTIVNAGHVAPLLQHRDGTVEAVGHAGAGLPLGIERDVNYDEETVSLAPGESIVLFNHGVLFALSVYEEFYSSKRLRVQLGGNLNSVSLLGREILMDLRRFIEGKPQGSDMYLSCFRRLN